MDVYCILSLVDFTILTEDQGNWQSVAVRQGPGVASLFTVSAVPGRICKLQRPRFAVEPRCRFYFAADVCRIPIAPDPLHHAPVLVSGPRCPSGFSSKDWATENQRPTPCFAPPLARAGQIPRGLDSNFAFPLFLYWPRCTIVDMYHFATVIGEEIRWRHRAP